MSVCEKNFNGKNSCIYVNEVFMSVEFYYFVFLKYF